MRNIELTLQISENDFSFEMDKILRPENYSTTLIYRMNSKYSGLFLRVP